MLYLYGSFLSKINLSLMCIVVPVPYVPINPSKKRIIQVIILYIAVYVIDIRKFINYYIRRKNELYSAN